MKVKLCIIMTTSAQGNKRPLSGEATFDDGKDYGWNVYGGEMIFTGSRNVYGSWQSFSFRSAARSKAVQDALDGNDPDAVVRTWKDHSETIRSQEKDRLAALREEQAAEGPEQDDDPGMEP